LKIGGWSYKIKGIIETPIHGRINNKSLPLHSKVLYSYYNKHIVYDREQKQSYLGKKKNCKKILMK